MKLLTPTLVFLALFGSLAGAAQADKTKQDKSKPKEELVWYTDLVKANEVSAATNKPVFALFTGSDWCFWCKKLQANVLSKPEFIKWANKNVVLVELDFPRGKAQTPELQQQNMGLQQTFGVQGYPTIWMFFMKPNAAGTGYNIEPSGSLGYPQGAEPGKEELKFIKDAEALLNKKTG